jgi:hypothetical protein
VVLRLIIFLNSHNTYLFLLAHTPQAKAEETAGAVDNYEQSDILHSHSVRISALHNVIKVYFSASEVSKISHIHG